MTLGCGKEFQPDDWMIHCDERHLCPDCQELNSGSLSGDKTGDAFSSHTLKCSDCGERFPFDSHEHICKTLASHNSNSAGAAENQMGVSESRRVANSKNPEDPFSARIIECKKTKDNLIESASNYENCKIELERWEWGVKEALTAVLDKMETIPTVTEDLYGEGTRSFHTADEFKQRLKQEIQKWISQTNDDKGGAT